ncbi:MAG: hypothetical protein H7A34_03280 [bacterium]|nr:hypothetical protein [bacterium]
MEYPAILLAAVASAPRLNRKQSVHFVSRCAVLPFAFLPIALQMYVNYLSFGSPFSTGYAHKAAVSQMYWLSCWKWLSGVSIPSWKKRFGAFCFPSRGMFYFAVFAVCCSQPLKTAGKPDGTGLSGIILCGTAASYTAVCRIGCGS